MSIRKDMSAVIASRLEALGKTQYDFADAIGVSQGTVSHWLSGRRAPRPEKYDAICEYLKISREELVGGAPDAIVEKDGLIIQIESIAEGLSDRGRERLAAYAMELSKIYAKDGDR